MPSKISAPPSIAALCLYAVSACGEGTPAPMLDAGAPDAAALEGGTLPSAYVNCEQMDVLFVIDNSPSMREEQQNLSDNFDGFVESLHQFRDGDVDFRIGVTTMSFPNSSFDELFVTSPSESGALLKTSNMTQPWLSSSDADLSSEFRTLATLGTNGGWSEQPLKAARAALVDRVADGQNAGFLRPHALLALVVLTDEDDVSTDSGASNASGPIPVSDFLRAFDELKGAREYWSAAVFAGGTAPTCDSRFGSALFAARLQAFVDQAGQNAVFHSICDGDLKAGLDAALATFSDACEFLLF